MTADIQHINSSRPQAAKEHTCAICGWPIERGQEHNRTVYKDLSRPEGAARPAIVTLRYHLRCPEVLHNEC